MKRILCLLLVTLMCVGLFAGCADTKEPDDNPTATPTGSEDNPSSTPTPDEPEKRWLDNLPEKDLGKTEIVFGYFGNETDNKAGCSVVVTEDTGDMIDSKVFDRNNAISERFNVTITAKSASDSYLSANIVPTLSSGDGTYDVLVGYQYFDVALARSGYLTNLSNLKEDYLDLEANYWAKDYINNINYQDKIFWITGDITLYFIGDICCSYVNSRIYNEYAADEFGNIYDLVRNREWTLENMAEIASLGYFDANGNDKADDGDQFGYMVSWGVEMAYAAGINTSEKDESGDYFISINSDRTVEIMEWLSEIGSADYHTNNSTEDGQIGKFVNGEVMIYPRCLMTAETTAFRNMEDDYYIVPLPMGTADCEDYRSATATGTNIVGIAYDSQNVENASLVLEALCAESAKNVIPTYYDIMLKDRYSRDDDSKEMIDLIHDKVGVDFVNTWSFGIFDSYNFYVNFDADTLASRIEAIEEKWVTKLDELMEQLSSIE